VIQVLSDSLADVEVLTNMPLSYFIAVLVSVSAFEDPPSKFPPSLSFKDPTPLSDSEQYLEPWVETGDLVEYRDSGVARKWIILSNLVDALPTWIEDLFIPLFIPHSTLTIPVHDIIPLKIPVGNFTIPLPANFTIKTVTMTDMNKFKKLKPTKLMPGTKFTWGGHISMRRTTISVETELVVLGKTVTATFTLPLANPDLQYSIIAAFNRTRLCDVWGEVMESSKSCALWPMFVDEAQGVSGLNLTSFTVSVSDFNFEIDLQGLGDLDDALKKELAVVVDFMKPGIIANLPGSISEGIRSQTNTWAVGGLADMHRKSPCSVDQLRPAMNISQVCFLNNAGFHLKWSFHNCPAHQVSPQTDPYPADVYECRNVQDLLPNIQPGQIIRVQTEAEAGFHQLVDPAFRFQPEANSGGFECDGSSLSFKCQFASVVTVDADKLPEVENVCVMNHGGFDMNFHAIDVHVGWSVGSGTYPINQQQCVNLGESGGPEGNEFKVNIHAVLGRDREGNRHVTYKKNGYSALYQCKGPSLDYHCNLLVEPKFTVPEVETVCVNNRGAYAMSFDAKDLQTGTWHGRTGAYSNPQQRCFNIGETNGVTEGDSFEVHANAGGQEAIADSNVVYKTGGGTATYQCGGSTLGIHCELVRDADVVTDVMNVLAAVVV
jgi:hypothetical protein